MRPVTKTRIQIPRRSGFVYIQALILAILLAACGDNEYARIADKIMKGQSRQDIMAILGNPYETRVTAKNNRFIWGPEEDFWDQIPMGARMETWQYRFSDGQLNLYFVNEGETLDFIAFAPKGVVY